MFKLTKLYSLLVPTLHFVSLGGSSGSSSSQQVLTQEQKDLLKYQTEQLQNVFMPAYTSAISGATNKFNELAPYANTAALKQYTNANALGAYGAKNAEA